MKRIGEVAAKLIANPIELVAAANQKRGTEFVGAPLREEGESEAPRRSVGDAHPTRATGVESPERVEAPGVTAAKGGQPRGELKLVVDNRGMGSATRRRKGRPDPVLPSPVLVWSRGGHAASGMF